jgi:hypothetical protein
MTVLREVLDTPNTKHFCRPNDRLVDGVVKLAEDHQRLRVKIQEALARLGYVGYDIQIILNQALEANCED